MASHIAAKEELARMASEARARASAPAAAGAGAGAAGAGAGAVPKTGIDFSKYTVYFTGILAGEDEHTVFTGNLNEYPSTAKVSSYVEDGKILKSIQRTTIPFKDFKSNVQEILKAKYCGGNVNPEYIMGDGETEGVFDSNPIRLVLKGPGPYPKTTRSGTILEEAVGFLIGRPAPSDGRGVRKRNGAYVEIICAMPGLGTELLKYFHKLVVAAGLGDFVKLSSLANVITLYPNLGYDFRKSCYDDPISLPNTLKKKTPENPTGRNFKSNPPPKATPEAYEDKTYLDFMYELHKAGLTVKEKDCPIGISKPDFAKHDCAVDGFSMAKCDLRDAAPPRTAAGGGRRRKTRGRRGAKRSKTYRRH